MSLCVWIKTPQKGTPYWGKRDTLIFSYSTASAVAVLVHYLVGHIHTTLKKFNM